MELELSEDQAVFVETTRRFLAAESPIAVVRTLESDPLGHDPATWRRGAALGWTSLLVDEAHGGGSLSEHGLLDAVLVAEEMGRVVAPGPLVPVNVVAAAVSAHGTAAQRAEVLPGLLDGTEVAAWCGTAPIAATVEGDEVVLRGEVGPVEAAVAATHLLVTVVEPGDGPGTSSQVLVPVETAGLTVTPLAGLDLVRRFASVRFDDVRLPLDALVGERGGATGAVEHQLHLACVLQCAESAGAMDAVLGMTLEYMGDRYSFGRPIASYQALKHRVADQKLWLEASHAIVSGAARAVARGAEGAGEVVSAAKAWVGPHATELVQDCIQLHGGIGVTWEHDLHLYLRRVTVNRATHGTPEDHLARVASGLLDPGAAVATGGAA